MVSLRYLLPLYSLIAIDIAILTFAKKKQRSLPGRYNPSLASDIFSSPDSKMDLATCYGDSCILLHYTISMQSFSLTGCSCTTPNSTEGRTTYSPYLFISIAAAAVLLLLYCF